MARKKIGDILIEKGLITQAELQDALKDQKKTGSKVGNILVEKGLITQDQLLDTLSERLNIPKIALNTLVIDPHVITMVPVEVARRYGLIPVFKIANTLTIAMADPLNIIAIEELKYLTRCDIKRVVSPENEIIASIDQYYSVADSLQGVIGTYPEDRAREDAAAAEQALGNEQDTPVVKLVNLLINQAVKDRASDIHIEPDEKQLRVRYRINGVMREEASPPKNLQAEIVSRIKVAANMDVSEKRLPQDGRMLVTVDGHDIDLRISTLPTIHGEKVVIRILDRRVLNVGLERLGFDETLLEKWRELIRLKEGLILITGPTSSGKTTTLYSVLQEINSIAKNIITVEDPVEYSLPLINQVQANEKAGLTFASSLRSILRQNPDIIMIGEIRDTETAAMAVRSALTGHLVFSTMHTNDAPTGVNRLVDMGIEKYLVASALKGVLAQRLVRTNCPHCTETYQPPEYELRLAGLDAGELPITFKRSVGCSQCRRTGFLGQSAIYELIQIDDAMIEMIITGASEVHLRNYAIQKGYRPLFQSGLDKVKAGQVSLEELLRCISIRERDTVSAGTERVTVSA
ncbi:MAG: Flp pilus assembly complex ATPase component TadA [candidate division Zixibacteria bacterium]|nr:Flp pilus assembly complex ATPase component TadA [candidate division Zixibacteria bacterium]